MSEKPRSDEEEVIRWTRSHKKTLVQISLRRAQVKDWLQRALERSISASISDMSEISSRDAGLRRKQSISSSEIDTTEALELNSFGLLCSVMSGDTTAAKNNFTRLY